MPAELHDNSRVAPPCRHFGVCGGCSSLDQSIDQQLARKRDSLAEILGEHIADLEIELDPPRSVPRHTRSKLLYPVRPDRHGKLQLGLYARGSHDLVQIEECRLQDRALTRFAIRAERALRKLRLSPYDENSGEGFVRALQARFMPGSGELLVGLVTAAGDFPLAAETAQALMDACRGLRDPKGRLMRCVGVVRNIQSEPGNVLLGRQSVPLKGRDYQIDRVADLQIRVSFASFYQVHRASQALLYRPALEMLGDLEGLRVVDAYGGVGTFALRLAKAGAARVDLVEAHAGACKDARHNATTNQLADRIQVVQQEFSDYRGDTPVDVCLVDPPRKGLEAAGIEALLAMQPQRILYVSCGPKALRRDLDSLTEAGYRVRRIRLADLFPHTDHVEALLLLERSSTDD